MKLIYLSWFLLASVSLALCGQAFNLQVIQGKEQVRRSEQNRFRIATMEADRGLFYDRTGVQLVENSNGKRKYLMGEEMAHVLGYIGEANEEELNLFGVEPGRLVGKMGLEREENGLLRGVDGGLVEEFSASGEKIRTFSQSKPIAGRNIQLTIDQKLQQSGFKALKDGKYRGSVIAGTLDGRILALAVNPSYDSNQFVPKDDETQALAAQKYIQTILTDSSNPMFNRAIAGLYPPASTFKLVTAIAALEEKVITADKQIEDTGVVSLGGIQFGNWYYRQYGKTDGMVNIGKAIQRSNDIFFYQVGGETGISNIAKWARMLGLGSITGIPLTGEMAGLVPTPEWKQATLGETWYAGETYNTSIGQGNLQTTPIQIQMMTTTIANDGWLCKPELVAAVVDKPEKDLDLTKNFEKRRCSKVPVEQKNLDIIKNGMQQACDTGGTGWPLFGFKVTNPSLVVDDENYFKDASGSAEMVRIPVSCKTGTAETGVFNPDKPTDEHTHAWFTAFAPAHKPEIVVTVMLEHAGQGSDKAAPIAREVLKTWFESKTGN